MFASSIESRRGERGNWVELWRHLARQLAHRRSRGAPDREHRVGRGVEMMGHLIVVVDTNQFYGDLRMVLRNFRILLGQHERGRLELAVPEVVLRELPKLFARNYSETLDKLDSAARKLSELGHDAGEQSELPAVEQAREEYESRLRADLSTGRVRTPPLPDTDLARLVDDSVAEIRPWQAKSRGFRDALIWLTVLDLAKEDSVVLVSNNSDDFAATKQQKDVLHADLRGQVIAAGHGENRVLLLPSLEEFIERHVPSAEQQLLQAIERLSADRQWREDLWNLASAALWQLDLGVHDDVSVVDSVDAEIDNVTVSDVEIENLAIVNAYDSDKEEALLLELRVDAVLRFSFTTSRGGGEWLAAERADVELEIFEETFTQGTTHARHLAVTFAVDYEPSRGRLGELEKLTAVEDPTVR
jgi:hypothetical protein